MNTEAVSPEFLTAFANRADERGTLRFDTFIDLALYDPNVGYYSRQRTRVGYGNGTDFFTASTSGPVFGELVTAACVKLLGNRHVKEHRFVEIGAETAGGILSGVPHPFCETKVLRYGATLEIEGPCVVFSNELFDAQPFRRFRYQDGKWRELGVVVRDGSLREAIFADASSDLGHDRLPATSVEGYTVDAPLAAVRLAEILVRQPWTGLFVAFDYGKSWQELMVATPAGTARAYYRHTQHNDLLARPGEHDLTCHICWDWLAQSLTTHGFSHPQVDTQESFFIHHAESYLAPAIAQDAGRLTPRKQSLLQLLHGSHLGQKFQVLHALR